MSKGKREFQRLRERLWYGSHHSDDKEERQKTGQKQSESIVKAFKVQKTACQLCTCLRVLKTGQEPAGISMPFCCYWVYFAKDTQNAITWTIIQQWQQCYSYRILSFDTSDSWQGLPDFVVNFIWRKKILVASFLSITCTTELLLHLPTVKGWLSY